MTSPEPPTVEARERELIEAASLLFAMQRVAGDKVRERTMQSYGRMVDAHLLLTGVFGSALIRVNGKITPITPTSEERSALFASFVIGMEACENAIAEGRYLQAHALLRQEMETVAQLKAVRDGTRNEARSPNVAVLEKSLKRLYDELSAAAHVAKHHLVKAATEYGVRGDDLPGPTSGTRYFPDFDEGLARRSFALHLVLTFGVIEEFSVDLQEQHASDAFTKTEVETLKLALEQIHGEGMIELGASS